MTYQWLLFDADNTLFDYDKAETAALAGTFADFQLGYDGRVAALYREINAGLWDDYEHGRITQLTLRTKRFVRLFARLDIDADASRFSDRYLQNLGSNGYLIVGALELIRGLHDHYRLAIITNGISEVQRPRLRHSPLNNYIETMIVSSELGVAKPATAIFDYAFAQMGHPAKEAVLIIGDSLTSDMQGGVNYGIDTCWYNPGRNPRPAELPLNHEIQELSQLWRVLDGRRATS